MKKLPTIGTTAASTAFCMARLDGPDGTFLYVDGNQKITASNGAYDAPTPNAFSLVAEAVHQAEYALEDYDGEMKARFDAGLREHCPGSTPTCRRGCYVHGLNKHAAATYELYRHNSKEIRRILGDDKLANWWAVAMAQWITENAAGGFRWHVSGDVFSAAYAEWIADVCRESQTVDHWIYTRSFDDEILGPLADVSTQRGGNLALNLSCDKDNYVKAKVASWRFGQVTGGQLRLCYLVDDTDTVIPPLRAGDVIFPDYSLRPKSGADPKDHPFWQSLTPDERSMLCPVDAFGKSEMVRCGICTKCLV